MNSLRSKLKTTGTFLTGVVGHHYVSKLLEYKQEMSASKDAELKEIAAREDMEILHRKLEALQRTSDNVVDNITKLADKKISNEILSELSTKVDYGFKQCSTVKELFDSRGPDSMTLDAYRVAYKAADACERANRELHDYIKNLTDFHNGKSNLVSNFNLDSFLDSFYEYLNSLGLLELSALFHLGVLTMICIFSFNILSAILGNEIINYFKLEERFPKLAGILKLRLKFQRYYLILNFSLIFIFCIASILINLLVLY